MTKLVKIKLLSSALFNNASGDGLIDLDSISDEFGLFYIPSKRIKGALRESATEILEMQNFSNSDIKKQINALFGTSKNEGLIELFDAHLENKEFYKKLSLEFGRNSILNLNSLILNQTSLDDNGVAKDGSLRKLRVIKSGLVFEMKIILKDEKFKDLIELSFRNLRRIGSSRNRGLGEIECEVYEFEDEKESEFSGDSILITLKEGASITLKKGDNFNIGSYDYIPATTLKGAILAKLIGELKDEFAKKAVVKNGYLFEDSKIYYPVPKNLEKYKYPENEKEKSLIFDSFMQNNDNKKTSLGKFFNINGKEVSTKKLKMESFFHTKRVREKQSSDKDDGAIFVYEALSKDQIFKAEVICDSVLLEKVKKEVGSSIKFGRSKNQGYSNAKISINMSKSSSVKKELKEFYMVCQSPLVLFDENGLTSPDIENLKRYLKFDIDEIKSKARFSRHKFYKLSYKSKIPETLAFEAGSVFKITLKNPNDVNFIENGFGELVEHGYGEVKIYESFSGLNLKESKRESRDNKIDFTKISDNQKEIVLKILKDKIYSEIMLDLDYLKEPIAYKDEKLTSSEYSKLESIALKCNNFEEFQKELNETKENVNKNEKMELTTFNQKIKDKCKEFEPYEIDKLFKDKNYSNLEKDFIDKYGDEIQIRAFVNKIRYLKKKEQKNAKN